MRRHQSNLPLPSHSGLFFNRFRDILAVIFLFLILISIIVVSTITYAIRRDCSRPYDRRLGFGNYWVIIRAGSTKGGCNDQ